MQSDALRVPTAPLTPTPAPPRVIKEFTPLPYPPGYQMPPSTPLEWVPLREYTPRRIVAVWRYSWREYVEKYAIWPVTLLRQKREWRPRGARGPTSHRSCACACVCACGQRSHRPRRPPTSRCHRRRSLTRWRPQVGSAARAGLCV